MNVAYNNSAENRFKEYLLEVVAIASETKKPVPVKDLKSRLPGISDSTVYSRADACVDRRWLTYTKTPEGYKAVMPTLRGFRLVGEIPEEGMVPDSEKEASREVIYVIWVNDKVHYSKEIPESISEILDGEPLKKLHIERQFLV